VEQLFSKALYPERRTKYRINCDYPGIVKSRDAQELNFAENVRVINLSTSGIYVVAHRSIRIDTQVYVKIAFPTGSLRWGTPRLATTGKVVRVEVQSDGAVGIAIKFQSYQFL
jgi:hypothetical protein